MIGLNMTRHSKIYTTFMSRLKKFKSNKDNLTEEEFKRELYKILILRGQYKEAKHKNLTDKFYQRAYRIENKERIRRYHTEYARKRRAKQRAEKNVRV